MKTARIEFSKTGRAKFISHLDLMRAMTRAVRRADIPLWYTEGFNRHPYITFAAPLSLGFEGLHETMDLRLEEDMPMEELTSKLDAVMPVGLRVLSAHEAVMKPGDLSAACYCITVPCSVQELDQFLAQQEILVQKRTKKKTMKMIDIRPAIQKVSVTAQDEGSLVEIQLPCSSSETVNPALFISALGAFLGRDSFDGQVVRTTLLGLNGETFQ